MDKNNIQGPYFHSENEHIKRRLKILYFCLHVEFFLTKKLNSLLDNNKNKINLKITNYDELKSIFDLKILKEKYGSISIFNENSISKKPIRNYFNGLSFDKKIILLNIMKSKYWNILFSELISDKKENFSMKAWNTFFNQVRFLRNTASHTDSYFNKKKVFKFNPIKRNKKEIEIKSFVSYLERKYNFKFEINKFIYTDKQKLKK